MVLHGDASKARARLAEAGLRHEGELSIGGSTWRTPEGVRIDVIEGREGWWPDALSEADANRDEEGAPVLPLHYLVLMKLLASRVQDVADVTRMLGLAPDEVLVRVREAVRSHAPEISDDLESLIELGRLETRG